MLRRSQGAPEIPLDLEIDRTLRQIRRVFGDPLYEGTQAFDTSSTGSAEMAEQAEGEVAQDVNRTFRDFGNPGAYELAGGILLPATTTNFTIHPS